MIYRVILFYWYPPKKLNYGKPRLGESTLRQIVLDTPNLAKINFSVLVTFTRGTSENKLQKLEDALVEQMPTWLIG